MKIEEKENKDKENSAYNAAGVRIHDRKERKMEKNKKEGKRRKHDTKKNGMFQ